MSNEKLKEEMDCTWRCSSKKNCVGEINNKTQFCISAIIFYANTDPKGIRVLKIESNNGVVEAKMVDGKIIAKVSNGVIIYE